jgi:hypothetical protein
MLSRSAESNAVAAAAAAAGTEYDCGGGVAAAARSADTSAASAVIGWPTKKLAARSEASRVVAGCRKPRARRGAAGEKGSMKKGGFPVGGAAAPRTRSIATLREVTASVTEAGDEVVALTEKNQSGHSLGSAT